MDGWMDRWIDGWMMDGERDGWPDGWMDGEIVKLVASIGFSAHNCPLLATQTR